MKRLAALRTSVLTMAFIAGFASCNREETDEVKINDFNSLKSEFKTPSAEYSTAPFFVWNYRITKEEIDHFLNDFREQGFLQVFVHPRPGLITEYLSDEWFGLFRYTVDKGKELGMKVWIYDENSYPSGFGGGHVPDRMPESVNQGQGLKMTRVEILPDTAEKYYICLKEENDVFTDITASVDNEKGKTGRYLLFSKTFFGKSDWYGGFSYVDLLYPGVTSKFIEITMAGYEKHVGAEFGLAVPGTFTDEPHINSPGGIRWTPDLFDVFLNKWGYDLRTNLPSLYEEVGDWKKIRHNYTQTLLQLFIDRWAKPWFDYCRKNNLIFTGHYWEHEWPNMRPGGDNMSMYAWHQMPAIDMLFNQWNDSSVRAQFGNVRSVKELSSAANQTGRNRKLSETYGGGGWELSFTDMKRLADWEFALGVNFLNQHLSHFTLAGARKYDYPLSFTYHEPWWKNYKYLNDHYARLSVALSSGVQMNDILILEPTTSAWLYDSYAQRNAGYAAIGQTFQNFITKLEKNQVEYDLGSENIIKDLGSVRKGTFVVGRCEYSVVVIPPGMENLDLPTFRLLQKFVAGGGTLVAFSAPSLIDGSENEELNQFLSENSKFIHFETDIDDVLISKYFSSQDIEFSDFTFGNLYHHRRTLADGQLIFIVNSSLTAKASGTITVKGDAVYELDTFTGDVNGYPWSDMGEKVITTFSLPPAGSLLIFIPYADTERYITPYKPGDLNPVEAAAPIKISRDRENVLTIPFCDLTLGGETTPDMHNYSAADKVYKYYGFVNGNPWNHSVQFKTRTMDRDTFGINTGFAVTYHFNVRGSFDYSTFRAVIERPYLWEVMINGNEIKPEEGEWWLDREFRVFDISSYVLQGKNTISLNVTPMKVNAEIEPIYITGDFSVFAKEKGWYIGPAVNLLTTGSWSDQGMPFYSQGISYSREYNLASPEGYYFIEPGEWSGTIAEVTVNGVPAPVIAFPPYRSDVTSLITPGLNKIEVKVTGSLKNLLGPHFNNPAPGLVSPGHFRNVKSYPAGNDYQLIDYGLMEEFYLLNGK
ncbi:MAG: hypothetical protein JXR66_11740 [Bacteroidales bacterium]|nr:hypothetical protein [Bacteroidales bacterium]